MRLCLVLPEIDTALVRDVCAALANYNARTWTCAPGTSCLRDPFDLLWVPDPPRGVIDLEDAQTLIAKGAPASCGELAAAYAGYLLARGQQAQIEVWERGVARWHVVARVGNRYYDPEALGRKR